MSRIIETANSTYELDVDAKRVRRVKGVNQPTGNFGKDGMWHELEQWQELKSGMIFLFKDGGITYTSPVKE